MFKQDCNCLEGKPCTCHISMTNIMYPYTSSKGTEMHRYRLFS